MIKSELINHIGTRQPSLPIKDIELSVNQIIETLSESLSAGKRIEIRGFGSFNLRYRAPRNAHNPKTGEKVATLAKYTPHFKPGKELRQRVNAHAHHPLVGDHEAEDEDSNE